MSQIVHHNLLWIALTKSSLEFDDLYHVKIISTKSADPSFHKNNYLEIIDNIGKGTYNLL